MSQTLEYGNWFSITSALYEDASVRFLIWSDRQDLNLRPLRPERSALARLSYGPIYRMRHVLLNLGSAVRPHLRPYAKGHLVTVALGLSITGKGGGAISPAPVYLNLSRAINSTT